MLNSQHIIQNKIIRLKVQIKDYRLQLELIHIPTNKIIRLNSMDCIERNGKLGQERQHISAIPLYFFCQKTQFITVSETMLQIICPIPDCSTVINYEFSLDDNSSEVTIKSYFEGESLYTRSINWMNLTLTDHPFTHWLGTAYGSVKTIAKEFPSGELAEMTKPLRFYNAAGIHDGESAFMVLGGGKPILKNTEQGLSMMCFADILSFNDNVMIFSKDTPLCTRLAFTDLNHDLAYKQVRKTASQSNESGDEICLESGKLKVYLEQLPDGIVLSRIIGPEGEFLSKSRHPLFRFRVYDRKNNENIYMDSSKGFKQIRVEKYECETKLYFISPNDIDNLNIIVTANHIVNKDRIEWKTKILNNNDDISVMSFSYPTLWFSGSGFDAILPDTSGIVAKDICNCGWRYTASPLYSTPVGFERPL